MSEREPGQLAYETLCPIAAWADLGQRGKDIYAAVEAAIRGDERAKVWAATVEECFKEIEVFLNPDDTPEYQQGIIDAIEALRAKIGDRNA